MAYELLVQQPETPITEKWIWQTDVMVADDGTEQRVSLGAVPKRNWSGNFAFDREQDIRRHIATMFAKFKATFNWPLFHMAVKLKVKAAIGATTLICNPARSDFRPGMSALIIEGDVFEVVTIDEVNVDNLALLAPLAKAFSNRASICPLVVAYSSDNSSFIRRPVNHAGSASFTFFEDGFLAPFIEEAAKATLQMFGGYPVLNKRAVGTEFSQSVVTGLEITDYGAWPSLRSSWASSQFAFPLTFKSPRGFDPADWTWWQTFADYCRGSTNPFFLPTWRDDFQVFTAVAGGGNQVTLAGTEYSEHYHPSPSFRRIVITKPDGTQHFAAVTGVALVGGNDRLTFTPAIPAGDWSGQSVSLLLKCRIADDTVSTEHGGLNSLVTLNIRTVD